MHEFGIRQRFELKQPRVFCSSWLLDIFDKPQSNKKTDALNFCKDENGFVDFVSSRIYMFVNLNMCDILFAYKNKFKVFTYIHIRIHVFHNIFFWQPSSHTLFQPSKRFSHALWRPQLATVGIVASTLASVSTSAVIRLLGDLQPLFAKKRGIQAEYVTDSEYFNGVSDGSTKYCTPQSNLGVATYHLLCHHFRGWCIGQSHYLHCYLSK